MVMMPDLSSWWPLPGADSLRDQLLAAYSSAQRGYHDITHLGEVLACLDELGAHGQEFDEQAVRLAAWFHDAVYAGAPDDEEQSARWAERALPGVVSEQQVDEVARLVRLTATHLPAGDDRNGGALCDADLAILAASPERYAEYARTVRAEYAHVGDRDFALGRAEILRRLAAKPHLFHGDHARAHWEKRARANLDRELRTLMSDAAQSD